MSGLQITGPGSGVGFVVPGPGSWKEWRSGQGLEGSVVGREGSVVLVDEEEEGRGVQRRERGMQRVFL